MSYRLYPVTPTELSCDDYRVKINGADATLDVARVSAIPFNRRWPGHQRPIDQTEIISFLSLCTDEALTLEITPTKPFLAESVKIRPQSLGITPVIENGVIRFTLDRPAYFTVEAYGRSHALHIFADPMPTYEVDPTDPNVLYYGPGEHEIGFLHLQSNQTLFLDEGAVVYGAIRANDAKNVKILGRGILDNSRIHEQILYEASMDNNREAIPNAKRSHTIQIEYCENVEIDGITIRDSLLYNIRPLACERLNIRHVKIIGCWRYNSDGIDMHNCRGVHISDCFLRTFDDSICVKGFDFFSAADPKKALEAATSRNGKVFDTFCDVLVERCVIWNDWGKCLEIGAETKAEQIYNITYQNCDLIHLTHAALDCMNVDFADVHDITYRDIRIECDEVVPQPILQRTEEQVYEGADPAYMPNTVDISVRYHYEYSKGSPDKRGKNHDFLFENIRVISDKSPRVKCVGYSEEFNTQNIHIRNLFLNGKPVTSLEGDNWSIGDFAENITLEYDPYAQMGKNDVDAKNQLSDAEAVKSEATDKDGVRVMFVGNSITLHGVKPEIGWHHARGMAASSEERDYVHILQREILKIAPNAAFCVCQVAAWEQQYKTGSELLSRYESARDFGANVILLRFVENVPKAEYDGEVFLRELDRLAQYLNGTGKASLVITTGFWRHPGDEDIVAYAKEKGIPCVSLGDLGEDDAMKAIGLFEHRGVANHPGDRGMQAIADRILPALRDAILSRKA